MKTFYIPVHFYEQEPEDDELVMLVTQSEINDIELKKRLLKIKNNFKNNEDDFEDKNEMVDSIFNRLVLELHAVWCYCKTTPQLVIGDNE